MIAFPLNARRTLVLLLVFALPFGSCAIDDLEDPNWTLEMLGPLVSTSANVSDIDELTTFSFDFSQTYAEVVNDAGLSGTLPTTGFMPSPSQSFGPLDLGPYASENIQEAFTEVEVSDVIVSLTFRNDLPMVVKSGTEIVLISSGTEIFSVTIDEDIDNGDTFSSGDIALSTVTIVADQLDLELRDLSIETIAGALIESNAGFSIDFTLTEADVETISLVSGKTFDFSFTEDFNLEGQEVNVANVDGQLILRARNQMPFTYLIDADLTQTESGGFIRTLVDNAEIAPATTDAQGNVVSPTETDIVVDITGEFQTIRDAKFIQMFTRVDTESGSSSAVTATRSDSLIVKVVGDLIVEVNN